MMGRGIELLVLDVHGVVLNNPLAMFLGQLADATGQARDQVRMRWRNELRVPTWTGQIREAELWKRLSNDQLSLPWRELLEARYQLGPAAEKLEFWAQRVPIWLLSNHRSDWLLPRLERFGLIRCFDQILVSDAIGALKPDPAAYRQIVEHVAAPELALFVDDKACNVAASAGLGIESTWASSDPSWLADVDRALGLTDRAYSDQCQAR